MNDFIKQLRPLLEGETLRKELTVLPEVKASFSSKAERLIALLDIYKIYIPNEATIDVYTRLYLAVLNSLERKDTYDEIVKLNDNFKVIKGLKHYGIIGGLESFSITGQAGIGKSSTLERCAEIIVEGKTIVKKSPYREVIPILIVESPADGSFKNLLFSILQSIDAILGTDYLASNKHQTTTIDVLLSATSNVLINHVGLLIIDEVERVANESKKGTTLINYLTQLVNQANISIGFVGNVSANNYFQSKEYLARRTIGIKLEKMSYGEEYLGFLKTIFRYQYVPKQVVLSSEISREIYRLTNGIPSLIIALFVETQRSIILESKESISVEALRKTFVDQLMNVDLFLSSTKVATPVVKKEEENDVLPEISRHKEKAFETARSIAGKDANKAISYLIEKIEIDII